MAHTLRTFRQTFNVPPGRLPEPDVLTAHEDGAKLLVCPSQVQEVERLEVGKYLNRALRNMIPN